jgi:hypothetical protein
VDESLYFKFTALNATDHKLDLMVLAESHTENGMDWRELFKVPEKRSNLQIA